MTRNEQLKALADVLQLAAEKAFLVAHSAEREKALATQLLGLAMEYEAMAALEKPSARLPQPDRAGQSLQVNGALTADV